MSNHTHYTKPYHNSEIPINWNIKSIEDIIQDLRGGAPLAPEDFTKKGFKVLPKSGVCHGGFLRIEDDDQQYCSNEYAKKHSSNIINNSFTIIVLRDLVPAGPNIGLMVKYYSNEDYILAQGVYAFKIKENLIDDKFLIQYSNGQIYRKLMQQLKVGSTQVHITNTEFLKIKIPIPPLPEQKAIAQVLSTADACINTTEKLIAQKILRKKWLMQQLLTGKKRLKGFGGEVKLKLVEHYLKEISERNKELKITNVLSVTNSRGFINQADQFDRVVASEDATNYKIVRKGQFAYNPSRVNVGSLDLLRDFESGILSPMYVVFETDKSQLLPDYFYYQLKTQWFYGHIPMFVQGSVRDSLSFDGLCSMKFFIPSIEEQTAIAQVLQAADKEISLLKAKAEKLREQKKGLMQVLLTGKVRLKIKE